MGDSKESKDESKTRLHGRGMTDDGLLLVWKTWRTRRGPCQHSTRLANQWPDADAPPHFATCAILRMIGLISAELVYTKSSSHTNHSRGVHLEPRRRHGVFFWGGIRHVRWQAGCLAYCCKHCTLPSFVLKVGSPKSTTPSTVYGVHRYLRLRQPSCTVQ